VVLVPGLFGSAFAFRDVVPMLTASGYRTIVIEPLGIGESAKPEHANYSLTAQADRVAAVLDTLAVKQAIFIGHSVGGSEGFRLAYSRPDLVRALVTIEGGPAETAATPTFKRAMRFAPWIKLLGGVRLIRWKIRDMLIASSGDASWVTDSVVRGYTAAAARDLDGTLKAFLGVAAAKEPDRIQPHLNLISCPVLLMIGTVHHQGDVGTDEITLLERTVPRFMLDSVAGAGHFLYEEHPQSVLLAVHRATAAVHSSSSSSSSSSSGAGDP
jgi:pimeloyl-ACP methyl ester carboxylesterase